MIIFTSGGGTIVFRSGGGGIKQTGKTMKVEFCKNPPLGVGAAHTDNEIRNNGAK
jgi:hypothetical protein